MFKSPVNRLILLFLALTGLLLLMPEEVKKNNQTQQTNYGTSNE